MVVVFGSINIDGVLATEHLPSPGETVVGAQYRELPGGKGANQAIAAARYGAEVVMIGRVGEDAHGALALRALRAAQVDVSGVRTGDVATGYASVWVDDAGNNQIVVASGANFAVCSAQLDEFEFTPDTTLLVQLEIPLTAIEEAVDRAHRGGGRIILNAAPYQALSPALLSKVDILLVNETEARDLAADLREGSFGPELAGNAVSAQSRGEEAARMLAEQMDLMVVLTLGAEGSMTIAKASSESNQGPSRHPALTHVANHYVPALPVQPIDTTGAGDTYAGCLAAALDLGESMAAALRIASVGSALACQHLGAQTGMPSGATVRAALGGLPPSRPPSRPPSQVK